MLPKGQSRCISSLAHFLSIVDKLKLILDDKFDEFKKFSIFKWVCL